MELENLRKHWDGYKADCLDELSVRRLQEKVSLSLFSAHVTEQWDWLAEEHPGDAVALFRALRHSASCERCRKRVVSALVVSRAPGTEAVVYAAAGGPVLVQHEEFAEPRVSLKVIRAGQQLEFRVTCLEPQDKGAGFVIRADGFSMGIVCEKVDSEGRPYGLLESVSIAEVCQETGDDRKLPSFRVERR